MSIDRAIDSAVHPVPPPENPKEGMPYPTHEGVLRIAGAEFRVYILNTGERIINAEDFEKFLTGGEA